MILERNSTYLEEKTSKRITTVTSPRFDVYILVVE